MGGGVKTAMAMAMASALALDRYIRVEGAADGALGLYSLASLLPNP